MQKNQLFFCFLLTLLIIRYKIMVMKKKVKQITKNTTIKDVLEMDESLAEILLGFGMHCIYCPMSQMESLEEAAGVHGIDVDFLVKKLNENKK